MPKPTIITEIEKELHISLQEVPANAKDPAYAVMPVREKAPHRYALRDGQLAGLNLTGAKMTDAQWQKISAHSDFQPEKLEALNLRDNQLSRFSFPEKMSGLRFLDLCNNQLKALDLPADGLEQLEHIWLYGNDGLVAPPAEVVASGRKAIYNYFQELKEQGEEIVYEAKMLILGDAGAGKTTLARKIGNPDAPMPEEVKDSTPGIAVQTLLLNGAKPDFAMHIWDFGGQEVYHSTHQFFLSKRSLYILLVDGRREEQFDYWLQMQELYGQESALLLVVNQKGELQPSLQMNELRGYYPNIQEAAPTVLNLKNDRKAVLDLRKHIEHTIRNLPQFVRGDRVPKKWAAIRRKLEAMDEDHILLTEFRKICADEGIAERNRQDFLLDFLHHLGAFLHFGEVAGLNKMVILRPEWATSAVYRVLDHTKAKGLNGHFRRKDLGAVWNCPEYEDYFEELLLLMEKFELCYQAPDEEDLFIVPSLLPNDSPEGYTWSDESKLQLHFEYSFMPKGILTRLIVRQHGLLENPPVAWQRGAVFCDRDARVEVQEHYRDKRINLRANGEGAKELLSHLVRDIDQLNKGFNFNERMTVQKWIPCTCATCAPLPTPHFYKFDELKDRNDFGEPYIACGKRPFEKMSVQGLLDGIFSDKPIGELRNRPAAGQGNNVQEPSKTVKIFLASSAELKEDREQFEIFINRENKPLQAKGIFLQLELWEDFLDVVSATRLQDEYNTVLKTCDLAVFLFFTKAGKYTAEEFDTALGQFRETGKPQILTYFKDAPVKPSALKGFQSIIDFKEKLSALGHFPSHYESLGDLKHHFGEQLRKLGFGG